MTNNPENESTRVRQVTELDRDLFNSLLGGFVPPNSFDAHAHLYWRENTDGLAPATQQTASAEAGLSCYEESLSSWMGDLCPKNGLFSPFPILGLDLPAANRFVAEQTRSRAGSRALRVVRPEDSPEEVETDIRSQGFAGFKVYHAYARRNDTFNASVEEFLPEWLWEIANRHELLIMLHLVRSSALLDPLNYEYIQSHCLRFSCARLIMAHAARGFCARHTIEGMQYLRGLDNIYFDTSGICESGPLEAILRTYGPRRLFFGSDFPVCNARGRCISIGDRFFWLDESNTEWLKSPTPVHPTLVGIESLLALKQACMGLHLQDGDVELIFGDAARALFKPEVASKAPSGQEIYRFAKTIIPGGTQLLSKRPEMFAPGQWPPYFAEARGVEVIDVDGRRFIDMTTAGLGACLLGYADADVNAAVIRRVMLGSTSTLNCPEEPQLARLLLDLHSWARMVRFARSGGEAMAMAVRIARAHTGRETVAFCGYHGWEDWYLAANVSSSPGQDPLGEHLLKGLNPAGVPASLAGTALPFNYNQIDKLQEIVRKHGTRLAAIVMEPTRFAEPAPGFLEGVRELADQCGAVFIFDEISSGWRMHLGGVHLRFGVLPDICVFGKALGNGIPMAAVMGKDNVMQAAQKSFISSTMWTEGLGPAAALATVKKMQQANLPCHIARIGHRFRDGLLELSVKHRIPLKLSSQPELIYIQFDHPGSLAIQTLATVRMLSKGFLAAGSFYPTLAHQNRHVDAYLEAMDGTLGEIAEAIRLGDIEQRIGGPIRHSGFARLA